MMRTARLAQPAKGSRLGGEERLVERELAEWTTAFISDSKKARENLELFRQTPKSSEDM